MRETNPSGALRERCAAIRERIAATANRSGRSPEEIALIGIGKTHSASLLRKAIGAGIVDLGENRVQEAEAKINELGRHAARWHLVGHLQANKARRAVRLFDFIHSLDSVALACRLDRLCVDENRAILPVLIQVDLSAEETKAGINEEGVPELVDVLAECPRLRLAGLMVLPPYFEQPDLARPFFRRLREMRDYLEGQGKFGPTRGELSMGMSHDFEVAIEEGATMVRVGTAIFGEREPDRSL